MHLKEKIIERIIMIMNKKRYLFLGLITGIMIGVGGAAYASSNQITAFLNNDIGLKFGAEFKTPPAEQGAILFENRIYLPARFVGESLGAKVDWNETARVATFTMPEPEKEIVYIEKEPEPTVDKEEPEEEEQTKEPTITYKEMPVAMTKENVRFMIENIYVFDNYTEVSFKLENRSGGRVSLDHISSKLTVNGKDYLAYEADPRRIDYDLEDPIYNGKDLRGLIRFRGIAKEEADIRFETNVKLLDKEMKPVPINYVFYVNYQP